MFQLNFEKDLNDKLKKMQSWAKQQEREAKKRQDLKTPPRGENSIDLSPQNSKRDHSASKLELSSFYDRSDVICGEYEDLHPRKVDSSAIVSFKKSMLESVIKPLSLKERKR